MCGIVGFIDKNKNIDTLNDMLKIQSYRGPDDSGVYFHEKSGVHFGHNPRLEFSWTSTFCYSI